MPNPKRPRISVYQMRIQLRGISPPIWRRVLVADTTTIAELHNVVQAAMGWEDTASNRFIIRGQFYGVPRDGVLHIVAGSEDLQLREFQFCAHDRFAYEYDTYSNWVHDIRIERIVNVTQNQLPRCIKGTGACPPEGSGPPDRFMEIKDGHSVFDLVEWLQDALEHELLRDDLREEFAERLPWANVWFDPVEANARLQSLECYIA